MHRASGLSALLLLTFGAGSSSAGAVLCAGDCQTAPPASTRWVPRAPTPPAVRTRSRLQTVPMSPGVKQPQLEPPVGPVVGRLSSGPSPAAWHLHALDFPGLWVLPYKRTGSGSLTCSALNSLVLGGLAQVCGGGCRIPAFTAGSECLLEWACQPCPRWGGPGPTCGHTHRWCS